MISRPKQGRGDTRKRYILTLRVHVGHLVVAPHPPTFIGVKASEIDRVSTMATTTTSANGVSKPPANGAPNGASTVVPRVPILPLSYDNSDSQGSSLRLIYAVRPEWDSPTSNVKFVRFTDGITNTLLKAINDVKGATAEEIDREAILLRAYGNGTHVIIDRQREAENHELLMAHGLAPELLARFENGMLYKFIRGSVTSTDDLRVPDIYTAVARRLAEWHATIPCLPSAPAAASEANGDSVLSRRRQSIDSAAPGKPAPNMWTVVQKWIFALPMGTEQQRERQAMLQRELNQLVKDLSQRPGLGKNGVSTPPPPSPAPACVTYLSAS